jgi:hypothetical protein
MFSASWNMYWSLETGINNLKLHLWSTFTYWNTTMDAVSNAMSYIMVCSVTKHWMQLKSALSPCLSFRSIFFSRPISHGWYYWLEIFLMIFLLFLWLPEIINSTIHPYLFNYISSAIDMMHVWRIIPPMWYWPRKKDRSKRQTWG